MADIKPIDDQKLAARMEQAKRAAAGVPPDTPMPTEAAPDAAVPGAEAEASGNVIDPAVVEQRRQQLTQKLAENQMLPAQMEERIAQQQISKRQAPKIITKEKLAEATACLEKYRKGKQNLERRIVENELWYRQQHWNNLRPQDKTYIPASGWVFNSLANKHADLMDNLPECSCLPQEPQDEETAKILSSVLPVVLENADFERTFSEEGWQKIKTGTGIYGVFWNPQLQNGLGDIDIKSIDIINLFWEPGIDDLQKSQNVFTVELWNNDVLISKYPDLKDKLGTPSIDVNKYVYDDDIDTASKSAVVDWYYKKNINGKTVLCYVKYVNDTVLYSSEDESSDNNAGQMPDALNGGTESEIQNYYEHGKYPFVVDALFPEKGTFAGFGYIDVMKDNAITIDRLNAIIIRNAEQGAMRRYFTRNDTSINMEEFGDWTNPLIHVTNGNLGEESLREYTPNNLSDVYVNVLQAKIDELKETSSNRDFSQGSTASGVTSGAAISALQEAGSKTSRDIIKGTYRAYTEICKLCIELMRQFYTLPRYFRVTGEQGQTEFQQFDNTQLAAQPMEDPAGTGFNSRLPVFDIKVKAHKANPFSRAAQNQDAINFFGMGFFNPQLADQALACLDMMDIEGKDKLVQRISQNGTLLQMVQQLQMTVQKMAMIIDRDNGTAFQQGLAEEGMVTPEMAMPESTGDARLSGSGEHPTNDAARARAQGAASV